MSSNSPNDGHKAVLKKLKKVEKLLEEKESNAHEDINNAWLKHIEVCSRLDNLETCLETLLDLMEEKREGTSSKSRDESSSSEFENYGPLRRRKLNIRKKKLD